MERSKIMIPIFDGEDYGMWKQRITMFLRYKECEIVTTRKTETDSEDWDKKDLKAINIIYSAITNRQLEYIREEKTAYGIEKKFDEMYLKESTALQIVCRRRLEKIRLDNYSDSASFFNDFEKLINELKCAGAQVSGREKLNYMLNTLPEEYSYIADIIDVLKEENQTVAYVKNKIEIAEKKNKSNRGEMQTNAFSARKEGCFRCGRVGHFVRECQNGVQAGSNNRFQHVGQHVVAAEEEETKEIRAGDVEISIVNQQPARASVTTGILQILWTDDGDKDVAALATMYIAEVPNEPSISQRSFHRMF